MRARRQQDVLMVLSLFDMFCCQDCRLWCNLMGCSIRVGACMMACRAAARQKLPPAAPWVKSIAGMVVCQCSACQADTQRWGQVQC
jgi:hypothetical protein